MGLIDLLSKLPLTLSIILSASSVVTGDYFSKAWSVNHSPTYFWFSMLFYALSGAFYAPSLLRAGLVTTSVMWSVLSITGFLFIGLVLFGEVLNTWQIVGVAFGIIALIILAIA